MGFIEITVDIDTNDVMLNIDTKSGKLIGLYVFNDAVLEYYSERLDDYKTLVTNSWKSKGNDLFLHCPTSRIAKVLKTLENQIFFYSEDLEEYYGIINKMINKYNLNISTSF